MLSTNQSSRSALIHIIPISPILLNMGGKSKDKPDDESDSFSESEGEGEQDENSHTTRVQTSRAQERLLQTAQDEGEKLKKEGGRAKIEVGSVKEGGLQWIPHVLDLTTADAEIQQPHLAEKEKFVRGYKDKFRGGIKNDTIIHTLVKLWVANSWKRGSFFKPLLQLILQIDPNILEAENEDGDLAFFQAVRERRPKLVKVETTTSLQNRFEIIIKYWKKSARQCYSFILLFIAD